MTTRIHPSAEAHTIAGIGDGTSVWHLAQIRERAHLGANGVVGRGVYVGTEVFVGDNCKIQNYALAIIQRAKIERALGRCT